MLSGAALRDGEPLTRSLGASAIQAGGLAVGRAEERGGRLRALLPLQTLEEALLHAYARSRQKRCQVPQQGIIHAIAERGEAKPSWATLHSDLEP